MVLHKLFVLATFFLGVICFILLVSFLALNWMNPIALILNLICALTLIGFVATIFRVFEQTKITQDQMSLPFQKFGESVAQALAYPHPIIYVVDHQFNASASREFGLFGRRIVAVGEAILATRDIEVVRFIVAHEITHLEYRDSLITSLSWLSVSWLDGMVGALNPFRKTGPERTTLVTVFARVLLFLIFLPIWAWLVLLRRSSSAISHELEYRADRGGVKVSSISGVDRVFGLLAYLRYFERENNYELYRDRVARFLSWIPLPEQTVTRWIAESESSASHPSVKARLEAARRAITPDQLEVTVEEDFRDLCESRFLMLAGGGT